MSAMGIICSPGLTHIIGPSSLSVGLCSLRLEKVPQGNVRCVTTVTHFTLTELLSIAAHADKTHTHTLTSRKGDSASMPRNSGK